MKKAFTLIELLVVVLIIGILAAVAVPQYQKAVEKAHMTEAIINLRAIANANQVYYLANGVYAEEDEIDKLDVQIPGQIAGQLSKNRIATKDFIYSPNGDVESYLALAWRAKDGKKINPAESSYYLYISREEPRIIHCTRYRNTPDIQKQLCDQINANGSL